MENLPREIALDILSRLPTTALHNAKLVCQKWYNSAQDPVLINMHFTRMADQENPCLILHSDYPTPNQLYALYFYVHNENVGMVKKIHAPEMPEFEVVGSCNGWLCLCDSLYKNTFHVYNPFTSDCIELPKTTQNSDQGTVFGFGFHPTTKEYKVVKFVPVTRNNPRGSARPRICGFPSPLEVQILTLGSPTWRSLGKIQYCLVRSPSQVLVNGRLHWTSWLHWHRPRPGRMLISLDLANERFREVPTPDSADFDRGFYQLVVLGGCLSAGVSCKNGILEIWTMKDYGVKESWIKEFSIGTDHLPRELEQDVDPSFKVSKFYSKRSLVRVLCRLKNGEFLLQCKCQALVSYDPNSGTFRDISVGGMPNWFEALLHVGSHKSLGALTGI